MNQNAPDPIETALLARLLVRSKKAPSEGEVLRSLRPIFGDTAQANTELRAALGRIERDGLRNRDAMTLTEKGRQAICAILGLGNAKAPAPWRAIKGRLVEVALGRTPSRQSRPITAGAVRAAALAAKLGLDAHTSSASDVLDAWAAREMGMDGKRLTIANVRAHVLSRALGIGALRDPKRIGAVATAHLLGVPRTDANTVRDSVLRGWLVGAKPSVPAAPSRELELHSFASAVKELARETTDGRFGRHKVFIGPIWDRARSTPSLAALDEREFKSKLVEAHRAGLLRLSRADLTPAMASEVVASSEVSYMNAVFHFVDLEGTLS